jgi:hypothetical protein
MSIDETREVRVEVRVALDGMVAEALALRYAAEPVKPGSTPALFVDALIDLRQRLDRVEELYGKALRVRGQARRGAEQTEAVAQDAFDTAMLAGQDTREEFSSARERNAEANLAALSERRAARSGALLAGYCDEAVELLRLTYRGLEGARQDILAAMRLFQFESALER